MHYNDLFSPSKIKTLLKERNIILKKSLGQNFLIDRSVVNKIIGFCRAAEEDTVIEIGAGLGVLTAPLGFINKRVIAYEIDRRFIPLLQEVVSNVPTVEIRHDDILNFNGALVYSVVGNIPYSISGQIFEHFLSQKIRPRTMTLVVQKEIADRMCSKPPSMSLLSLSVQYYGKPEIKARISSFCFFPKPEVDSALINITMFEQNRNENDKFFFQIAKAGFAHRRKFLMSNLLKSASLSNYGLNKTKLEYVFTLLGLQSNARAQELSVDQWISLAKILHAD